MCEQNFVLPTVFGLVYKLAIAEQESTPVGERCPTKVSSARRWRQHGTLALRIGRRGCAGRDWVLGQERLPPQSSQRIVMRPARPGRGSAAASASTASRSDRESGRQD